MVFIGEPGMVYAQVDGEWVPIGTLEPGSLTFGPDTPPPPAQPVITPYPQTVEVSWPGMTTDSFAVPASVAGQLRTEMSFTVNGHTARAMFEILVGLPSLDRYQRALPCGAPRCHNQRCRKYLDVEYGPDEFFCSWVCQMRWYEARQEA